MNLLKYLVLFLVICSSALYYSCDDAGVVSRNVAGEVSFIQEASLKPLDPAVDGLYNMWVLIADSLGNQRYLNLGRFNVLTNGSLVNENGDPMALKVDPSDTVDLGRVINCRVTIEQGTVVTPGPVVLLGGTFTVYFDSVVTNLRISDPLALGATGDSLSKPGRSGLYILYTPSNNGVECEKGIWMTDENGNPSLPDVQLNPGGGWRFRGWVRNKLTNEHFTTGSFYNPAASDSDEAGPCAGTLPGLNGPGQDWISMGCANVTNLRDGNYEVFVVLEPRYRDFNLPPFNLKVYWQSVISPSLGCSRNDNLFSQHGALPKGKLKISK